MTDTRTPTTAKFVCAVLSFLILLEFFAGHAATAFSIDAVVGARSNMIRVNVSADHPRRHHCFALQAKQKDGYKFGDITRGFLGKFQGDVKSLTGKPKYEFGDFSRWLAQQGRGTVSKWVEGFTHKPQYQFGDLSRELIRRLQSGEYSSDDLWLMLKVVALVGINFQPVAGLLPVKVLVELLEVGVAQEVSGKVMHVLTSEVDARMKEFVTGDRDYKVGDLTKKAVTGRKDYQVGDLTKNAVQQFIGKDSYQLGDISKTLWKKRQEIKGGKEADKILDLDAETKQAFEEWDKNYLQSKRDDKALSKLELDAWDQKLLDSSSK